MKGHRVSVHDTFYHAQAQKETKKYSVQTIGMCRYFGFDKHGTQYD